MVVLLRDTFSLEMLHPMEIANNNNNIFEAKDTNYLVLKPM